MAGGFDSGGLYGETDNLLIALTARPIGAALFTRNGKDFQAIRGIRAFELVVL